MDHFAGLDVSVKDTSVCIVDDTGKIIRDRRNRFCTLPKHGFRQATCFDPIIGAMMLKALVDEHKLLGQFRHECRLLRSLSEVKWTSRGHPKMVVHDPLRPFALLNCCCAKCPVNPVPPVGNPCCNRVAVSNLVRILRGESDGELLFRCFCANLLARSPWAPLENN
jgi:hypothetical protein